MNDNGELMAKKTIAELWKIMKENEGTGLATDASEEFYLRPGNGFYDKWANKNGVYHGMKFEDALRKFLEDNGADV